MQTQLKLQLSAFMFLQYFIWGSWYVTMGDYMVEVLKFGGQEIGAAYGALAIGSMISPFFVGLIADRFFASEKILGVLGILGGAIICLIPQRLEQRYRAGDDPWDGKDLGGHHINHASRARAKCRANIRR